MLGTRTIPSNAATQPSWYACWGSFAGNDLNQRRRLLYQVMFFANMGVILTYGLLGTLVAFVIIAVGVGVTFSAFDFTSVYDDGPNLRDVLIIGATFCATDSVAILQLLNQVRCRQLNAVVVARMMNVSNGHAGWWDVFD